MTQSNSSEKEIVEEDGPRFIHGKKFCIEYAKTGRAKCKKCNKFIVKDQVRIGKNVRYDAIK